MKNPLLKRKNIRRITRVFNSDKGLKYIPYGIGSRYIAWVCSNKTVQKRFFKKKLPIVREFLDQFPGYWDEEKVIAGFFTLNYLHGWRASSISHMSNLCFKFRVGTEGVDGLRKAYDAGNGVILLGSHYGLPAAIFTALPRMGFRNFYTILGEKGAESIKIKGLKRSRRPKIFVLKRGGESDAFSMLFEAKDLLEKGNIVHLLGDGSHGKASHNLPFLGKVRGYRATFAELSLLTGAPVIPVFIIPEKGKIKIIFEKALDAGSGEEDREERVEMMMKQYSDLLEKKWLEDPANINGGFMEMYNRSVQLEKGNHK